MLARRPALSSGGLLPQVTVRREPEHGHEQRAEDESEDETDAPHRARLVELAVAVRRPVGPLLLCVRSIAIIVRLRGDDEQ